MIQELSTKEKIKTLEWVLKQLENKVDNCWLCNLVASYMRKKPDTECSNSEAIILIPELLKYKPEHYNVHNGWFLYGDYETRIKAVKALLKNLKRRKT